MSKWRFLKVRGSKHKRYQWQFNDAKSKATWDPYTNLFAMCLNVFKVLQADISKSRKKITNVMREHLGAGKHICIVYPTGKGRGVDVYATPVQFYCLLPSLPGEEVMERLPEYIADAIVPIELWQTDANGQETLVDAAELGSRWGTISKSLFERGEYKEEATGIKFELL